MARKHDIMMTSRFFISLLAVTLILATVSLALPSLTASMGISTTTAQRILIGVAAAALLGWGWGTFSHNKLPAQELVPEHIRRGLDGLSEAVLVLDFSGAVVFTNHSFLQFSGYSPPELEGRKAKELDWSWIDVEGGNPSEMPWLQAVKSGRSRTGRLIGWPTGSDRVFVMTPVSMTAREERPRGALISLLDVTRLHQKQGEIASILSTVRESSLQIRQQQAQMDEMALRDSLTGCFHRRYGMERLTQLWRESDFSGDDLAGLFINLDYLQCLIELKGESCGDQVLQRIAAVILEFVQPGEVACRYEGDVFLVLLPGTDAMEAVRRAETLRKEILRRQETEEDSCHVSIGIACRSDGSSTLQEFLTRAKARLHQAKEEGRNRVCWISSPSGDASTLHGSAPQTSDDSHIIPYAAVTALFSALAFRDNSTATHCRRVADLCVTLGQRLMSMSSCYVLEMSALLHDIGKIGVPDSLLHKPAALTDEEWNIMHSHDAMGVEIVRAAFAHSELTEIIENYPRRFDESLHGTPLPLGARILAVADAYDSMTTAQIYRAASSPQDALAELRRCAGHQFDPEIVSHFEEMIRSRNNDTRTPAPIPRQASLAIGLALERLSAAVDMQDLDALKHLSVHLAQVANELGAPEISMKSLELGLALETESDRLGILQSANDLLNHCRATQFVYASPQPEPLQTTFVDAPSTCGRSADPLPLL